jgi:hypothetical protein
VKFFTALKYVFFAKLGFSICVYYKLAILRAVGFKDFPKKDKKYRHLTA